MKRCLEDKAPGKVEHNRFASNNEQLNKVEEAMGKRGSIFWPSGA